MFNVITHIKLIYYTSKAAKLNVRPLILITIINKLTLYINLNINII